MEFVTDPDKRKKEKLSRLMEQYERDLLRMCCVYLRDASMAEDAVQECFLKAYKALDSFEGRSRERTWLYSIAMNVCRDMRRTAWFRYVDRRVDFDQLPIPVAPASDVSIALMTEVMRLPRKYMEVVWLHYYEDLDVKEIGQMLGVTASAVSHRMAKARRMLRGVLEGDVFDE